MDTKIIRIDREHLEDESLREAAGVLRTGGLVAFPTETVYGLGANGLMEEAARKIYAAKGRPSDNPLILHIAENEEIFALVAKVPDTAKKLMDAFWPGPLTIIFPKSGIVPYEVTGGLNTVAVRMPSDEVARRLIKLAGVPVAAPSANLSGRPSPTTSEHVAQDMNGRIEIILDGGQVGIGMESTIVDVTGVRPMLLRPGAVTLEMLGEVVGEVEIDPAIAGPLAADVKPKAPGMKYRHYAPKAQMYLVEAGGRPQVVACPQAGGEGEVVMAAEATVSPSVGGGGVERASSLSADDKVAAEAVSADDEVAAETVSADDEVAAEAVAAMICRLTRQRLAEGRKVGILCTDETKARYSVGIVRSVGTRQREETIAHNLFAVLREFDDLGVDVIYSESFAREHLGQAIMNRLTKAAGYQVIYADE